MIEARDWDIIERLQEGIPLCAEPYALMAAEIGMTREEFLTRTRRLTETGVIRRLGPRVRHTRAGITGNIMAVWRVPPERQDEVGEMFAADSHVSHCYSRPSFPGFPYTLYTMIHARDTAAVRAVVAALATRAGVNDVQLLETVREFKKTSPRYRRPGGDADEHQPV